tara:strand:+ start:212 stop:451 length:240 start_codon:yes stop_codon:yes gene_type:complete
MKAIIYSDRNIESGRAQQLLKSVRFDELVTYYLDDDFNNTQFQSEFGCDAPYPQITIGTEHVGGLKDTLHYLSKKGLIV